MTPEKRFSQEPSVNGTDDGVAYPVFWFIVYTRVNYEKKTSLYLNQLGYETFVPTQKEVHKWSDRKKVIERVLVPMIVFVRMPKEECDKVENLSFIQCFLRRPCEQSIDGRRRTYHERAILPDQQVEDFRIMVANAIDEVTVTPGKVKRGDRVRVRSGGMKGIEGIVERTDAGNSRLVINIDYLGCAAVSIDMEDLEFIDKKSPPPEEETLKIQN